MVLFVMMCSQLCSLCRHAYCGHAYKIQQLLVAHLTQHICSSHRHHQENPGTHKELKDESMHDESMNATRCCIVALAADLTTITILLLASTRVMFQLIRTTPNVQRCHVIMLFPRVPFHAIILAGVTVSAALPCSLHGERGEGKAYLPLPMNRYLSPPV
jgi:hypothetical protein